MCVKYSVAKIRETREDGGPNSVERESNYSRVPLSRERIKHVIATTSTGRKLGQISRAKGYAHFDDFEGNWLGYNGITQYINIYEAYASFFWFKTCLRHTL